MTTRQLDLTPRAPEQLAHVVIMCHEFEKTKEWYMTVLDAKESYGNEGMSFLSYDEEHHRLALINAGPAPEGVQTFNKVQHFAYTLSSAAALLGHHERLAQLGIKPVWNIHHGLTLSMYYEDPEGIHVEFQVDAFVNMKAAKEFMSSEEFEQNPVGIEYNPEDLKARYLAGESETELLNQVVLA